MFVVSDTPADIQEDTGSTRVEGRVRRRLIGRHDVRNCDRDARHRRVGVRSRMQPVGIYSSVNRSKNRRFKRQHRKSTQWAFSSYRARFVSSARPEDSARP